MNDAQPLCNFTVSQVVVKTQAECSGNAEAFGFKRLSVHGREHGEKCKMV